MISSHVSAVKERPRADDSFKIKIPIWSTYWSVNVVLIVGRKTKEKLTSSHRWNVVCIYFYCVSRNVQSTSLFWGHLHRFWDSGYLCHFSTEMAEIWCPGTSFQDDWTYKFSALYLLYFQSYETFSWGKSGAKLWQELKELKFFTNKWRNLSVSEPSSVYALSVLNYGLWH